MANENEIDLSVNFCGINLSNPVFTASGTCGYADELSDFMDINALGGFITKSITVKPRMGNPTPRIVETDSGLLNAIGLANIGLDSFIDRKLVALNEIGPIVFVNVAGESIEEYKQVCQELAYRREIAGFEVNISCPNVSKGGINFGTEPKVVEEITSEVKKVSGDKILMVKLSPSVTNICEIARAALEGGADALSLINTFTGMAIDIHSRRPVLANRTGGLSGPAIKPIAVYLVNKVYSEVTKETDVPILGTGGVRSASDVVEFLLAGATAVGVGTWNFVEPDVTMKIIEGLKKYCAREGVNEIKELIGSLER